MHRNLLKARRRCRHLFPRAACAKPASARPLEHPAPERLRLHRHAPAPRESKWRLTEQDGFLVADTLPPRIVRYEPHPNRIGFVVATVAGVVVAKPVQGDVPVADQGGFTVLIGSETRIQNQERSSASSMPETGAECCGCVHASGKPVLWTVPGHRTRCFASLWEPL